MASLSFKIAFNILVSYAGRILSTIFALVIVGFIARSLGPGGFGQYATILALLSLFVIFADLGLHSLMTREISREKNGINEIASNFFTLRLLSSLIFLSVGFMLAITLPYPAEIKLGVGIGAVGFFFLSAHQVLLGVFQKHLKLHMAAFAEVVGRVVQILIVYLIYVWSVGQSSSENELLLYIFAMSFSSFIIFLLALIFARRYIKIGLRFDMHYWAKIIRATWPIALSIVLTLIYFKIDTIFLSFMKPQEDVGIYGVAYRVLEGLIFFPAMFAGIIMPILSRDAVSDLAHFKEVFRNSIRAIAIFAAPLVGGGIVLSYSIVNLIGGRDFLAAGAPMQALFVAVGIIFFGNILGRAVIALDLQKKAVFAYLFGVVLNVALNLVFIPKYTYMGAAWTTVVTELLITLVLFWIIFSKTKIMPDTLGIIKAAFAAAVMSGVLLVFVYPITAPLSFLGLGLATVAGAGIYFFILYLLRGISREEIWTVLRGE